MQEAWIKLINKYSSLKEVFVECEETDPELKTNIQPLNEFRAALDHVMRMMDSYYSNSSEHNWHEEFRKLNSHLDRAFFDVCDMLSINYRNKIIDSVEIYTTETIRTVLPKYYSEWKTKIEEISNRVIKYRNRKTGYSRDETFQNYKDDIFALRDIYNEINSKRTILEKIENDNREKITTDNRLKYIAYGSFIAAIIGIILSLHPC